MIENDVSQQEDAANIPLTVVDITEFQSIWREVTGEAIDMSTAAAYGRQLLAPYKHIYKPITQAKCDQQMADQTAGESDHG